MYKENWINKGTSGFKKEAEEAIRKYEALKAEREKQIKK